MQRLGNIRYWLNYHIWMGVTGPLFIVFHTAFKWGGIVAISFWSMMAVALSGVLGRYLYLQIPRSLNGQELSASDLDRLDRDMQDDLRTKHGLDERLLARINSLSGAGKESLKAGWSGLLFWLVQDLTLGARLSAIRREIEAATTIKRRELSEVRRIIKRKVKLRRRRAFLATAHDLLHHWHVIHKPFAAVMLIIMVVHVVITVAFGYTWIF